MAFAIKEVSIDDIPERQAFGAQETERSKWIKDLLDAFLDSNSGIWELCEGIDGPFRTSKEAASYSSSIMSQAKKKKYASISCIQRGKRIFISKVKIITR